MLAALAVTAIAAVRAAQPTPIVSSPSSGAEDALIRALMIEIQLREKEIKGLHF